jgi:hypothetical protein
MGLHTAFTALAEVIDAYESRGRSIQTVEASPAETGDAVLDVTVAMPVSLRSGGGAGEALTPQTARLTDSGDLEVTFSPSATELPSTAGVSLSIGDASATVTDDGLLLTVQLTIDATAAPDEATSADCGPEQASTDESATVSAVTSADTGGSGSLDVSGVSEQESASIEDSSSQTQSQSDDSDTDETQSDRGTEPEEDAFAAVRDDSVPPYEDTDYLQALYDECDNFREIAEQIQMDVSSETVRRYMIEADIHVPNSYNTSSDDEEEAAAKSAKPDDAASQSTAAEEAGQVSVAGPVSTESAGSAEESVSELPDEQLVTDGLGLPADVRLQDIADAVVDSDTVYEVQRCLSLDRGQTRDLLEELNLLDLVLCRLADEPDQAVSYGTVAGRIRQCTPHSA